MKKIGSPNKDFSKFWSSSFLPSKLVPYLKIMRLHSPAGAILLMWPAIWSLTLASSSMPSISIILTFIIGSFLMRSAGCIINDIIDRDIDKNVERTKNRPLANGTLSLKQAFFLLFIILLVCFALLLTLNKLTIIIGLLSIIPICIYPYMKRIINWPQLFLGFTFNIGALMAWTAVRGEINIPAIGIYMGSIFWTLGYDTIYAHQDKIDDIKIGVKSTALSFSNSSKDWISIFYRIAALFLVASMATAKLHINFYIISLLPFLHLFWQVEKVNLDEPSDCERKFKSNVLFGLLVFVVLLIGALSKHYKW